MSRHIASCRWRNCLPAVFPDLQFVRVVRANKVRQAVSLWKAVQTATWSESQKETAKDASPPYKSFLKEHRPGLRFHYRAIEHLLQQILIQEGVLELVLRARTHQADSGAVRELRQQLHDEHGAPPRTSRTADTRPGPARAAPQATVRRDQRRLGAALQRHQARDGVRSRSCRDAI